MTNWVGRRVSVLEAGPGGPAGAMVGVGLEAVAQAGLGQAVLPAVRDESSLGFTVGAALAWTRPRRPRCEVILPRVGREGLR